MFNIFRGFKYYVSSCWNYNKSYIILLIIKQIVNSLSLIIGITLPGLIINALFVLNNNGLSINLITFLLVSTLILNVSTGILEKNIFLKRMLVFKEFQLFLGKIVMDADFCNTENSEYLDTREKAYKYLYGNSQGFGQVLENGFQIMGNCISIIAIGSIISQLSLGLIILLIIIVTLNVGYDAIIKRRIIKLNFDKVRFERRSLYFSNLFSDFRYGKEIRVNRLKEWLADKYENQLNEMQKIYEKICDNNNKSNFISSILYFIQQAVLYCYVIYRVIKGSILVGNFSIYLSGISQFSRVLKNIMNQIIDLRQCTDYFSEFEKYVSMNNSKIKGGMERPVLDTENFMIEFCNVSYRYNGQSNYALKNISLVIHSNKKVAILGENGSGKSTFIKLLLRIYEPTEGKITLNGINISDIDYDYYIRLFSTVFQDYKLFSMSLRDNIELNCEKYSFNYDKVFQECGLDNKVKNLNKGIDTYVYKDFEKSGFEPSGGEGQKIAFVRALYKNTPIAILDEATAALDPKAEANIYEQFDRFFYHKTILYISHRMSVTKFCDMIIVFKNGRLVESGIHEALIQLNGEYADLYNAQAKYYK